VKTRAIRLFAAAFLAISVLVLSQQAVRAQPASGSLMGTIRDGSGAAIPGVKLLIANADANTARQIVSDAAGDYLITGLAPGPYEVVATRTGLSSPQVFTLTLNAGEQLRTDLKLDSTDSGLPPVVEQQLEAMQEQISAMGKRIGQLEAALEKKNAPDRVVVANVGAPRAPLLATTSKEPGVPFSSGAVTAATEAAAEPGAPTATPLPKALEAPDAGPVTDSFTPFAFGDFTWLNGNPRNKDTVLDTKFFTPEIRFDTNYTEDTNQPKDHSLGGSTETFRNGEVQIEQASVGGDFHWQSVRGRILTMFGMFATTTPRNDASTAVGQWDLRDSYRYVSEAWGGYHFNVNHGLNIDAGIFTSYIGLFSYYNYDNWTYQPSYVSSNTPWFFNGVRLQWFPTNKLKIEPWFVNGWQSYAKFNGHPGLGGQILYRPHEWLSLVFNNYGLGTDTLGNPNRSRIHTDDSIQVRYYNKPEKVSGLDKMAFSFTGDLGCEYGGGVTCHGGAGGPKQAFLGWMAYNRWWFGEDRYAITLGGGMLNNPGRYLTLLPPINGADAVSGSPYFTENPGDKFHAYDLTTTFDWMPRQYVTWRFETGYRHSDVPYWTGRGGVTPPGGNNGSPADYACSTGVSSGQTTLAAAQAACGGPNGVWFPDLRRSQFVATIAVMVKF
jgi:hypothetical protein